jgi:hypothetical protein
MHIHAYTQQGRGRCIRASLCWRMLTYADVCWRMLTYADAAGDGVEGSLDQGIAILTYADICWHMQTYADVCWRRSWRMLTYADVCWRMLTYADECWRMLAQQGTAWMRSLDQGIAKEIAAGDSSTLHIAELKHVLALPKPTRLNLLGSR